MQTATHLPSVSSAVEQVIRYATITTLTSSANPASVSSSGTPTGTVTFKNGAATLGTGTLNASGIAMPRLPRQHFASSKSAVKTSGTMGTSGSDGIRLPASALFATGRAA